MEDNLLGRIVQGNELMLRVVLVAFLSHACVAHIVIETVQALVSDPSDCVVADVTVSWVSLLLDLSRADGVLNRPGALTAERLGETDSGSNGKAMVHEGVLEAMDTAVVDVASITLSKTELGQFRLPVR